MINARLTNSAAAFLLAHGLMADNATRWLNRAPLPHWIEFTWAARLRLGITATQDNVSRIWEVELYAPPSQGQP